MEHCHIIRTKQEMQPPHWAFHSPEQLWEWILQAIFQTKVFVDTGSRKGIQVGDFLESIDQVDVIKNLDGIELGRTMEKDGNRLIITEVAEDFSICTFDSFSYEPYYHSYFAVKFLSQSRPPFPSELQDIFPLKEGQKLLLISREEGNAWKRMDAIYRQISSDPESPYNDALYKELIKEANAYLVQYTMGNSFFIDQVIFQKGFALHKIGKHEEAIDTFNLYLRYFPGGQSVRGAREWIQKSLQQRHEDPAGEKKKVILFLGADPSNPGSQEMHASGLRLDREVREIDAQLKSAMLGHKFTFVRKWAVTPDDIQQALLDHSPDIVHFSGHGKAEGIIVEDRSGRPRDIAISALANTFRILAGNISCVVLNACYSAEQAKEIVKYIPYVIGMNESVKNSTAMKFSIGFYKGIGAGRSIDMSFELGVNAIQLEGLAGQEKPVLMRQHDPASFTPPDPYRYPS